MCRLSVILPAYNEEQMIAKASRAIGAVLEKEKIAYELIFVDDGSTDRTWEQITEVKKQDSHIVGIQFSRNFGKEAAIYAGLAQAGGDVVAVMDCDLQHPPETLLEMYRLWQSGCEVIEGVKSDRGKESSFHRGCAQFFYKMMSKATKVDMSGASDFKMMDRKVVDSILSMPERNMFFRATSSWVGYRRAQVEFEVRRREAGTTKWTTWSLVKYAITNLASFTTAPLQLVTLAGGTCFFCSFILLLYSLIQFFRGNAVEGYTTTIFVLLFIGSAIMMSLGIIGYYIAKIYEEVKRRPRYIISNTTQKNHSQDTFGNQRTEQPEDKAGNTFKNQKMKQTGDQSNGGGTDDTRRDNSQN